jgi:SAM-dependent methyltransferase
VVHPVGKRIPGDPEGVGVKKPEPKAETLHRGSQDPPLDWVITETLDRISGMHRFNRWLFDEISPFLGRRVLEVGSGLGNFSGFFVGRADRPGDLVVLSDISDEYLDALRTRFGDDSKVLVENYPMEEPVVGRFSGLRLDSIVALNVLEHVEKNEQAVRRAAEILVPGGHLILLVPAWQGLYCDFDRLLGHYRRYRRTEISDLVRSAELEPVHVRYFNMVGALGWFFSGKILRRKVLPRQQLHIYDKMVPILRPLERLLGPPFGLSVFCVAQKPRAE